nr:hypothetical protein [Tanacetum cinerariifolium]
MATTIEQQVALDETLVPSAQRLRIGRSNFRLPSNIQSKESTLQVVYDVLRRSPFFKAFLVTADGLYHKRNVDYAFLIWEDLVYQMEHKNQKKSNEMYCPRFTKVIIHHFMMKKPSIPRRNRVNWHYVRVDILTKTKASARKKKGVSASSTTPLTPIATLTSTVVAAPRLSAAAKGKQPARATSHTDPSDVERTEAEQLKIVLRRSRQETHISQQRGSSTDEGTETKKVNDDDDEEEISKISEQEATESDEGDDEEAENSEDDGNNKEDQDLRIGEEERIREEEEADELYRDVDINQGRGLQVSQETEDSHVILTLTHSDAQQESSSTSSFVTNLLNPIIDPVMESIFTTGSSTVTPIPSPKSKMTLSIITTTTTASQLPIPPTPIPSIDLQNLLTFASVFHFEERVKSLEVNFFNIPGIVHQYMHQQMPEAIQEAVQIQTDRLQDSIQRENNEFLKTIDDNMKKIIKEHVKNQVKAQVTRILPRIEESVNAQLEAEVLTRSSHSSRTSYAVAADLSEIELKKILIEKMEGNKSIQRSDKQQNLYKALVEAYDADKTILDTYGESAILKSRREDDDQEGPSAGSDRGSKRRRKRGEHASASTLSEPTTGSAGRSTIGTQSRQLSASESAFVEEPVQTTCQMEEPSHPPKKPPTPDRDWNKSFPAAQGNAQSWISPLAKQTDARSSFNKLLDTPIDFSNFIMNRLGVDTLTPELLAGPTYELMRGSCNSLTELEYYLEEVYKATTDQLDWDNPKDLEYLWRGASSQKYTTSVTKTKAADYGHIKWIEDLFYGFAVNRESALDVYSKRRIIAVTDLKIVKWHNYKHLDWISLSNLTVEERFAFNISLRMFTRSIVIQRRVEDLQLGVESYQKRLNLTKLDTYRFDLKRREAYTAYSNPRGFIYQNRDKKNRLMRIDELYKFSDGTLNDVRNALDDRLKGIRMQYLPTTIWRKWDKDRAAAMTQTIDKMLKTKRIMRSLERFVGGRQYEGDS